MQLGYGQPEEYFHRHTIQQLGLENNPQKFLSYCEDIFQRSLSQSRVFGLKIHWYQLQDFLRIARQLPAFTDRSDLEILTLLFPHSRFIYLCRQDITAQAVSAAIATQTGQWEKPACNTAQNRENEASLKFQPWRIYEWDQALKSHNQGWQDFFQVHHTSPYTVSYEALTTDFSTEISKILNYLSINEANISETFARPTQRQSNKTNQQFIHRYNRLPQPLLASIYWLFRQLKPATEETAP